MSTKTGREGFARSGPATLPRHDQRGNLTAAPPSSSSLALYALAVLTLGVASHACADACLGEQEVEPLVRCIRLNLDCADVCETTGRLLSRQTEFDADVVRAVVGACAETCRACGAECDRHAEHMEHCRVCAETCRRCEEACRRLVSTLAA